MSDGLVKILDGNTFVVSDARGDIEASLTDPTGLFSFDTRFLSKWVLTVDGQRLNALSADDLQYFETRFFLVPGTGTVYVDAKLSVIRRRAVGDGFHEELTILNHDDKPVDLTVRIEAGCDFADLFEVKDALQKKGTYYDAGRAAGGCVLGYERETFRRETTISATAPRALDKNGLTFKVAHRAARRLDDRPGRRHRRSGPAGRRPAEVRARDTPRAAEHGAEPRAVARGRAAARVRLGRAQGDVPAQPRRPRRAALLAARSQAGGACPPPACRGS